MAQLFGTALISPGNMHSDWQFNDEQSALQCAASRDAGAYSPMQRIAAIAYLRYESGQSDKVIGALAGISPSAVRHHLRLWRRLSPDLFISLHKRQLSIGHAKLLASQPVDKQLAIAEMCREQRWPVLALKSYLRNNLKPTAPSSEQKYYQQLGEVIGDQIGFPVKISIKSGGPQGKMEIQYFSLDDFDTLCQRLGVDIDSD